MTPNNTTTTTKFTGDSDTYGLGVRLGIYLQWLATFLATTIRTRSARTIRTSNTIFLIANFAGLLLFTFHRPQVYAIEPLIVLFIVFGAAWPFILLAIQIKSGINEAILRVVIYTAMMGYIMWYFWSGMDVMIRPLPPPGSGFGQTAFFFAKVDLFGWFRTLGKVFAVLGSVVFLVIWIFHIPDLLWARYPILNKVWKRKNKTPVGDDEEEDDGYLSKAIMIKETIDTAFRVLFGGIGLINLILMIVGAEMMIAWNQIQGVNRLDSTGQLIPAFLGLVLLVTTVWETIENTKEAGPKEKERRQRRKEAMEKKREARQKKMESLSRDNHDSSRVDLENPTSNVAPKRTEEVLLEMGPVSVRLES
ncbi:hypothetical protein DTO164E3_5660 [Paecilomyces variotii]|nr:hypothetical protein DTO032I3_7443 [Paecilomyces variotii]KAJ9197518.1 hypothetical protein DTO164E3_5660 [Paecilomyces variotii]KAJ9220808.1 hypothetical protein DTO169C6_6893 [Paecilomyces variotii]KAJ9278062.1 hypothetical protein DTO021D3_5029 [Paecilomyces variotii]KAJ9345849.1 hypothetical protein DTO027B6_1809 [Paecilomyces variotii]